MEHTRISGIKNSSVNQSQSKYGKRLDCDAS